MAARRSDPPKRSEDTEVAPTVGPVALGVMVTLAVVLLAIFFAHPKHQPNFDDTAVYWGAGEKALHHQTAYDVTGHYTFNYLPFAALFYAFAFAVFPIEAFGPVFYALSVVGWTTVVIVVGRAVQRAVFGVRRMPRRNDLLAIAIFALFFGMGIRDELKLGQTMIVPLATAVGAFLLYERTGSRARARTIGTDVAIAGLVCFAIEIKIYFAVLVPWLFFRRELRIVLLVAVWHVVYSFGLVALYSGPAFAFGENLAWFRGVRYAADYHLVKHHNVSVMGVVAKIAPRFVARSVWLACTGALLALLWRLRDKPPIYGLSASLAAVVVLNPIAWPYWTLLGFPAVLLVAASAWGRARSGARDVAFLVGPSMVLHFVMSATQNEDLGQHGGLLLASATLAYLVAYFGGAFLSRRAIGG